MKIAINQIIPDPDQPRKTFNPETLKELSDSLNGLGLIQPITVRPYQDSKYMIIVGERRFTAAKQRGDNEIECIIREDVDDKKATEMQFAENSQQEEVPPIELGKAFYEHRQKYAMSQRDLAQVIGLSYKTIQRHESLYSDLRPAVSNLLEEGKLGKRIAFEISTIKDVTTQEAVGQLIVDTQLPHETAVKVITTAKAQPQKLDEVIRIVTELPKEKRDKALDSILSEINHKTIEQTQDVLATIEPEIKMETPDDLRKAAQTLYKEAQRKAQESMTPEEKSEAEAKKKADKEAKQRKEEEYRQKHQPAIEEAKRQLLNDPDFITEVKKKAPKILKRIKREEQRQVALTNISQYQDTDRHQIILGALNEVYKKIAYQSIDVIITDPPYGKEYLSLYSDLAEAATYLLKPNGSLLVMTGQSYLPEILLKLSANLTYHWIVAYLTPGGQSAQLWDRKVNTFWKPILWFVKGEYEGDWVGDVAKSSVNDNDKDLHEWGQSESGMADIVERFSKDDDLILDPFMGAGTTGKVALKLGRRFIGIDKSEDSIAIAKQRLG